MITYGFRGKFVTIESMTSGERERYSRQILFREIGETGQDRLLQVRMKFVQFRRVNVDDCFIRSPRQILGSIPGNCEIEAYSDS